MRHHVSLIFAIVATISRGAYSAPVIDDGKSIDAVSLPPAAWEGPKLDKIVFELKSHDRIRRLLFHADGSVSATLGRREGPFTSPLVFWHISGKWVHIVDDTGKFLFEMRVVKSSPTEVSADNGKGEIETYAIKIQTNHSSKHPGR